MIGEGGDTTISSPGGHQNSPFRGWNYIIPYMAGKLAPNSSYLTRGLVKYVPGRAFFRAVPSQKGTNFLHPRPPPQSLNGSEGIRFVPLSAPHALYRAVASNINPIP